MWIFFKGGAFLSIVQKPTDKGANTLTVRARAKGDIERIFHGAKVVEGEGTDYLYRAVLPRSVVVARIADAVEAIDFSNFKDTVWSFEQPQKPSLVRRIVILTGSFTSSIRCAARSAECWIFSVSAAVFAQRSKPMSSLLTPFSSIFLMGSIS